MPSTPFLAAPATRHLMGGALALALVFAPAPPASAQGGAAPADTVELSIEDAVTRALRTGDEARLAEAQVEIAEAQSDIARASALPQLRLNSTYQHVIENARAQAVGQIFNQPNSYNTNLNLSQTFFQGGREIAGIRAAGRVRDAARLSATETRARVAVAVQRAYLGSLLAGRLEDIAATGYRLASERLGQVEQFQQAGRAARYDVLRARVERANYEPQLIQARNDRALALIELRRLTNIAPDVPLRLTTSVDTMAVRTLLAAARDTLDPEAARASVRAAELTLQARRLGVSAARADWLPTVSAFIQSGYQAFPASGFPSRWGELETIPCPGTDPDCTPGRRQNGGWFSDRSVGVQLSWPLFDGLRARAGMDLARAQARVAEVALQQEREAVAVEVAQARAGVERARALWAAQRSNVTEADEAFRLASLRYTRGLGTQLESSDAQLALLTAQTYEARALYDLYLATAELARALGRPVPLPTRGAPAPRISSETK